MRLAASYLAFIPLSGAYGDIRQKSLTTAEKRGMRTESNSLNMQNKKAAVHGGNEC